MTNQELRARTAILPEFASMAMNAGEQLQDAQLSKGFVPNELQPLVDEAITGAAPTFSDRPLTDLELATLDTWFVAHPEKIAGTQIAGSGFIAPVRTRGNMEDLERVFAFLNSSSENQVTSSTEESTFEYYLTRRPPSIGTHPKEGIKSIKETDFRGKKVWLITYNRKLSENEVQNFELTPKITNTVEQLREQEKAEYRAIDPTDSAKRKEIYDKYDKLITPLLMEQKKGFRTSFKNELGARTDVFVLVPSDNATEFRVETTVHIPEGDQGIERLKIREKWFPIDEYDSFVADLKDRSKNAFNWAQTAGLTFVTHTEEVVSGQRLVDAINKVADNMVVGYNKQRHEYYAPHITEKQKDEFLVKNLKYAEEVRQGQHLNNFSIWQRIDTELTGETAPLFASSEPKTIDKAKIKAKAKAKASAAALRLKRKNETV